MFGVNDFSQKIVDFANFDVSQLGTALVFGAAILLIGMIAIFGVLITIWACLAIFKFVFHDLPSRKAEKPVEKAVVADVAPTPVSDPAEVIAAIAAAIAIAESESSGAKFRVVSFRRK